MQKDPARQAALVAALVLITGAGCAPNNSVDFGGSTGGNSGAGTGGARATGGSSATGGASATGGGSGGTNATGGVTGTGGANTGGSPATGGAGGHAGAGGAGGRAGAAGGGTSGTNGSGGAPGTGGSDTASCLDNMQNGTETGVDCGGSCGACPNYKINPPNLKNMASSGCQGGSGFMCARSMVFSPEFKQAAADDFGSATDPPFVYGTVGHDPDTASGGVDSNSNTCCECYQLVFTTPRDPVSGVPTPKPMIVQTFNTAAGGAKNFDIYMAMGGYGANAAGCMGMYSMIPTVGEPSNGGIRVENLSQCSVMNQFTEASIASSSCQSALMSTCDMLQSTKSSSVQATSQGSCIEANQPGSLYHMNWNVMAKRIECPANLTRVTGCKLNSQNLPQADPTAVDSASASSKGFASGYSTTTMQDCCRPTCAYSTNVTKNGNSADSQYGAFYTCDASGNPS